MTREVIICNACATPHEMGVMCSECKRTLNEPLLYSWGPPTEEQVREFAENQKWMYCPFCGAALGAEPIEPVYDLQAYH